MQSLFGRPQRVACRARPDDQDLCEIDPGRSERRGVGKVRRRDPGEPFARARERGERGPQDAKLADAFVARQ